MSLTSCCAVDLDLVAQRDVEVDYNWGVSMVWASMHTCIRVHMYEPYVWFTIVSSISLGIGGSVDGRPFGLVC